MDLIIQILKTKSTLKNKNIFVVWTDNHSAKGISHIHKSNEYEITALVLENMTVMNHRLAPIKILKACEFQRNPKCI